MLRTNLCTGLYNKRNGILAKPLWLKVLFSIVN